MLNLHRLCRWTRGVLLSSTVCLAAPALASDSCRPDLPTIFPTDHYVFRGVVTEPALPREGAADWAIEIQVASPIHLPRSKSRYEVVITAREECARTLDSAELRDRYASGDEIKIVAVAGEGGALRAHESLVSLTMAEASSAAFIKDPFDYYEALLQLDRRFDDLDRVPLLRHIAQFVEDPARYRALLKRHLESKTYRRQLTDIQKSFHEPP